MKGKLPSALLDLFKALLFNGLEAPGPGAAVRRAAVKATAAHTKRPIKATVWSPASPSHLPAMAPSRPLADAPHPASPKLAMATAGGRPPAPRGQQPRGQRRARPSAADACDCSGAVPGTGGRASGHQGPLGPHPRQRPRGAARRRGGGDSASWLGEGRVSVRGNLWLSLSGTQKQS